MLLKGSQEVRIYDCMPVIAHLCLMSASAEQNPCPQGGSSCCADVLELAVLSQAAASQG